MNFSIAALLANFADDKSLTLKALQKKLHCEDEVSQRELQIAVDALERVGILVKDRGKYQRVLSEDVVEGKLRCSSKGFCFAIQDDENAEDIYVRESHLNTAWNGDRVLVQVTKEGNRRRSPEGAVKVILERANVSVLARVKQEEGKFQAVPLDDRLLFEINLEGTPEVLATAVDQLAHVEVVRYPLAQDPPIGRIVQVLGTDAEAASDRDIVFCKYDLPREFSAAALAQAAALPPEVREEDRANRLDLRDVLTISLGDPNGPSQDGAFSISRTEEGDWQLGVHIIDITPYVPLNSPIDQEALKRGSAIHLDKEVVPLLPPPLAEGLGRFAPGSDRLAISLQITLGDRGQVLSYAVQPSVIRVDHHLTYSQAQGILSGQDPFALERLGLSQEELAPFSEASGLLRDLYAISQDVRQQRLRRGAFELTLPDHEFPADAGEALASYTSPKFQYNDEGLLGAIVVSSQLPTRRMVTEFTLLANQLVADHLVALQVPAIYRVHRAPNAGDVQDLVKLAETLAIELTLGDPEQIVPMDYQRFVLQFATSPTEKILTYLLLDTFKPAFYSTHPGLHFGLALENGYVHFAAPTRRYGDLMIHRVLHGVFEQGRDRRSSRSKDGVNLRHSSCHGQISWSVLPPELHHDLEEHIRRVVIPITERERVAQDAESDLEGFKKAAFMRDHTGSIFHGLITGVQSYGFFVEIEELLVEGLVHVSSLKDDWYEYRSRQQRLVGRKNRRQFRLGDAVEVQVKNVDYYRQQIDLVAVGGGSVAPENDDDDIEVEPPPRALESLLTIPAGGSDESE